MNISTILSGAAFAASLLFTATSCKDKQYVKYQCPMKCEKEKSYTKSGDCPICGMQLKGIQ